MSISQTELQKIAEKLSKIPGDNSALLGNITDIIKYMDLLNEVDTEGVIPTISVVQSSDRLREDILTEKDISPSDLLACSEQKVVGGLIALPNIMK